MPAPPPLPPIHAPMVDPKTGRVTPEWIAYFSNPRAPLGGVQGLTGDGTATGPGTVPFTLANTGVTPGTYGDSTHVPRVTVDAKGRATAASLVPLAIIGAGLVSGQDGEDGWPGPPGVAGPAGATGASGATGPAGPPGFALDGTDGEDGVSMPGLAGTAGAAGATGATGPAGLAGVALDGIDGEDGAAIPGPAGPTGATGATGAAGSSGAGTIGPMGLDGEDGADGACMVAPPDAWVKLGQVVTASSQATVDFSNIPAGYSSLKLVLFSQDTQAGTSGQSLRLKVNNDGTAANYTVTSRLTANNAGTILLTNVAASTSGVYIASHPQGGNTGDVGGAEITLPGYAQTTFHKRILSVFGEDEPTNQGTLGTMTARWKSTAAITQLTVLTDGTAFRDGSTFTLYGLL